MSATVIDFHTIFPLGCDTYTTSCHRRKLDLASQLREVSSDDPLELYPVSHYHRIILSRRKRERINRYYYLRKFVDQFSSKVIIPYPYRGF